MKKKILKIVLIIVLIFIVLFLIKTMRNFIIIKNLQDNIQIYCASENYHMTVINTSSSGNILTMNYYEKDGKQMINMENITEDGEIYNVAMYNNAERVDIFYDNADGKKVQIDTEPIIAVNISNYLETESNFETFIVSMFAKIKTEECNGHDCYVITNFLNSGTLHDEDGETIYVEKDTGLLIKLIEGNSYIDEREYEFNNVSDDVFIEPDIGQYTLITNDEEE